MLPRRARLRHSRLFLSRVTRASRPLIFPCGTGDPPTGGVGCQPHQADLSSQQAYAGLPASLELRELRFHIPCHGQRTRVVTIVSTLLDPVRYPKEKIAELYGVRWR